MHASYQRHVSLLIVRTTENSHPIGIMWLFAQFSCKYALNFPIFMAEQKLVDYEKIHFVSARDVDDIGSIRPTEGPGQQDL